MKRYSHLVRLRPDGSGFRFSTPEDVERHGGKKTGLTLFCNKPQPGDRMVIDWFEEGVGAQATRIQVEERWKEDDEGIFNMNEEEFKEELEGRDGQKVTVLSDEEDEQVDVVFPDGYEDCIYTDELTRLVD